MKNWFIATVFVIFCYLFAFGAGYIGKNIQCEKAKENGAEVVWIKHDLLGEACYINETIDDEPVHMDADDWLKYFVYDMEDK